MCNDARNVQLPHSCRCMELVAQQPFLLQETVWLSKINLLFSSCTFFQNNGAKCHCIWSKSKVIFVSLAKWATAKSFNWIPSFHSPTKNHSWDDLVKGTSLFQKQTCIFLQLCFERLDMTFWKLFNPVAPNNTSNIQMNKLKPRREHWLP